MPTRESPRIRRLRSDLRALERLRDESSILDFTATGRPGHPPDSYSIRFRGSGLYREDGATDPVVRQDHVVTIQLGASYPRMMPELAWKTPIFHPNISASGVVCLGGYGTHWVPSLGLDEMCSMLWDMIRYQNYDTESPYNREAAAWARTQKQFSLPLDPRPIRDRIATGAVDPNRAAPASPAAQPAEPEVVFLDDALSHSPTDAAAASSGADDIFFID